MTNHNHMKKEERNQQLWRDYRNGETMNELAKKYQISKARAHQIITSEQEKHNQKIKTLEDYHSVLERMTYIWKVEKNYERLYDISISKTLKSVIDYSMKQKVSKVPVLWVKWFCDLQYNQFTEVPGIWMKKASVLSRIQDELKNGVYIRVLDRCTSLLPSEKVKTKKRTIRARKAE